MKHLQTAQKVVSWLALTHEDQPWAGWARVQLVGYFRDLRSELQRAQTRRGAVLATEALAQPPLELPSARAVLQWVEELKDQALAVGGSTPGTGPLPLDKARLVRDACMVTTAVGHTAYTHRGTVLWSMKAPEHAAGPCPKGTSCPASLGCHGNRLERIGDQSAAAAKARRAATNTSLPSEPIYQMVVPHHKNTGRGKMGVCLPITNPKETQLLTLYIERARPALAVIAEVTQLYVGDSGEAYDSTSLCLWWSKLYK